ncbi:MAG: 4-hydroxy-tetrahydrodipicolinate reductase [Parvibaculaceae bacterium]|jgi:4-hydroxy-tetrahydrodipicolinate reductase
MSDLKIVITGAAGRMGRTLVRQVTETAGCTVWGGLEPEGSAFVGQDTALLAGYSDPSGVCITTDPLELFAQADAVIDFSVPDATAKFAGFAAQARIVHVIGTTGIDAENQAQIKAACQHATIIQEGNMSLGVNLLGALVKKVAATLDIEWDIEILEMHHRHKVDAPSGTALLLGEAAADGRGVDLNTVAARGRDGITGARKSGDIGFASLRGGSVVGEHSAIFAADSERLVLSHIAEDRAIFARGAVKAALWGKGKGPGLFGMADVLGLSDI